MTTTAAPGTPARPAPAPASAPAASTAAAHAGSPPSGFRAAVVLAVLLTGPAVDLVARGELSAHDALVRFGCAWAFATGGVALVLSTVGGGSAAQDGKPVDVAPGDVADPASADAAPADPAYADPTSADPARVDDATGTPAG